MRGRDLFEGLLFEVAVKGPVRMGKVALASS